MVTLLYHTTESTPRYDRVIRRTWVMVADSNIAFQIATQPLQMKTSFNCNGLLAGAPKVVTDKLQRVMNSAARVVTNTRKFDHGLSHVRHEILHWLDVPERVTFKLCLSVYKCLHGMGPPYLSEMCLPILSLPGRRHLRSAIRGQLAIPRYRLTTAGRRAFSFAGPSAWNSLLTYLNDNTHSIWTLSNVSLNHFCFRCTDNAFSALEIFSKW